MQDADIKKIMPLVMFNTIGCEDIFLKNFGWNSGRAYKWYATNNDGYICYYSNDIINDNCLPFDVKEVSIYEAIPELIPDGMRYNKELHKLVPDVVGDLSNDIIYLVDEFQKNKDFKTKTYGDIKKEVLQRENIDIKEDDKQILDELKKSGKSYLQIINLIKNTDTFTPSYYGAKCKCGEKLDAYAICDKYSNKHKTSAWHHAVKKLIRAGDGHKPLLKDIDEVIDSLKRWKEQLNAK